MVICQFDLTGGNPVGFEQPVNFSGAVLPSFSFSSPSRFCHLTPSTKQRGHAPSCRKARDLRYKSFGPNQVFSCGDPSGVPERARRVEAFDGFLSVLRLKGPFFLSARTAHVQHFLEEVAEDATAHPTDGQFSKLPIQPLRERRKACSVGHVFSCSCCQLEKLVLGCAPGFQVWVPEGGVRGASNIENCGFRPPWKRSGRAKWAIYPADPFVNLKRLVLG